jgi:hypothetical protein
VTFPSFRWVFKSEILGRYSWYQRSRFKFRTSGVELRRSILRYILNVALKHVVVIDVIGDLNSSPFNRRRPVKRMKYSISHECRDTKTWFI